MSVESLIAKIQNAGLKISLVDGNIELKMDSEKVDEALIAEIRVNKPELINFLEIAKRRTVLNTIPLAETAELYPASHAQKRIWVLDKLEGGSEAYHIPAAFNLLGELNENAFEKAFLAVIERHESLRTVFIEKNEEVYQKILDKIEFDYNFVDQSNKKSLIEDILLEAKSFALLRFNLEKGPLFRTKLIKTNQKEYYFFIVMHHIITDGWSVEVLLSDLFAYYLQIINGGDANKEKLSIQYKDYSQWQYLEQEKSNYKIDQVFWKKKLADLPILDFTLDKIRPSLQTFDGETVELMFNKDQLIALRKLRKENQVTSFVATFSVFNLLICKYCNQNDLVLGTGLSGRNLRELEDQIGFYVNTIAVRTEIDTDKIYKDWLVDFNKNLQEHINHQNYPFDKIVEDLGLKRDMSRSPIFDIMFYYNAFNIEKNDLVPFHYKRLANLDTSSKFDMAFSLDEVSDDKLKIQIQYNVQLFDRKTIEKFAEHYLELLEDIADNHKTIASLTYFNDSEKELVVNHFNNTKKELNDKFSIIDFFEETVTKFPLDIAIKSSEQFLTYDTFNKKINQFAHYLAENYRIGETDRVAVMMDKSEELFISIMAVLKLGAAYIPVDLNFPEERQRFMLQNSESKVLISKSEITLDTENVIFPEEGTLNHFPVTAPKINRAFSDLTYIMYTSGSTGNPKGVMIEDKSVIRLVKNTNYTDLKSTDNVLQLSNCVFDGSVFDIFGAFLNGATLFLVDKETILSGKGLGEYIRKNKINISFMTTALFNSLVEEDPESLTCFDKLYFGGENCSVKHIETALNYRKNKDSIVHVYGPTECATFSTYYEILDVDRLKSTVPIGKAISNSQVYILDSDLNPAGLYVKGEICIGGLGLSRGYVADKELNSEKFIKNPFADGKLYRSGDYGRINEHGNIEFLGRIDQQVKINGFRIELAEIENKIRSFKKIQDVFVSVLDRGSSLKQIVAYCKTTEIIDERKLRIDLSKSLPAYMIPTYFIFLEELPLNINGKVDKSRLPEIKLNVQNYIKARNKIEEILVSIWQRLLKLEFNEISINSNFFEIGGNSINAIKLKSAIHKEFNVELKLNEVFKNPSIEQLSLLIENSEKSKFLNIPVAMESKFYPLSPAQERMFILHQIDENSIGYNMTFALSFLGEFELEKLKIVNKKLIEKHSSLRTKIRIENDLPVQEILDQFELNFEKEQTSEEGVLNNIKSFVQPFNVLDDSFIRMKILEINSNHHIVVFDICHLIADGTSITNLLKDFIAFYSGEELEKNRIDYKDFSVWQRTLFETDYLREQEKYWLDQFKDIPVLDLPTDYTRSAVQSFEGKTLFFEMDKVLTEDLRVLANKTDTTLFMVLLSIFNILLHKYSGKSDIVVGTPLVGRIHPDLESIVGLFLNTLVLRNRVNAKSNYESLLLEIKNNSLKSFENQEYPFDDLVDKLQLKRDISRNPLFDCMFNLLNIDNVEFPEYSSDTLTIKTYDVQGDNTKFDLYFNAYESKNKITFALGYAAKLYKTETIQRLADHFIQIAKEITKNVNITISDICITKKDEERKIVDDFNSNAVEFEIKTIHQMFEEQVFKTPESAAISFAGKILTYRELNSKANQLAHFLRDDCSIEAGDFIGICSDRNMEMIIAILGIVKTGAAYVAIDPSYPEDRILHMLEDSKTKLLLSDRNREGLFKNYQSKILNIEELQDQLEQKLKTNLKLKNSITDPIYVVYTSGSTGMPNGAILSHDLLANLLEWQSSIAKIDGSLNCLQFTSLNFCVSFQEIFSTLTNGGTLYLIDEMERRDTSYLMNFLQNNSIENLYLPFSYLNFLFNEYKQWDDVSKHSLKNIITAGEQ
jgi:amino acid adenylation domain-containing protein